jgi:hypothetical protein
MAMATMDHHDTVPSFALSQGANFKRALEPDSLEAASRVARVAAQIGIGGVRSPEEALIRIMHGRALGITAMQALRFVYVIQGRAGVDATLMRALCLAHRDCEEFALLESTPQIATFRARRRGHAAVTLTWTIEDARRARLSDRDTWRAYPAQMLRARATAELARLVFPDAVVGLEVSETAEEPRLDRASVEAVPASATAIAEDSANAVAVLPEDDQVNDSGHEADSDAELQESRRGDSATREPKLVGRIWREELEVDYEAMRGAPDEDPEHEGA